jgi:hypothetical protein
MRGFSSLPPGEQLGRSYHRALDVRLFSNRSERFGDQNRNVGGTAKKMRQTGLAIQLTELKLGAASIRRNARRLRERIFLQIGQAVKRKMIA